MAISKVRAVNLPQVIKNGRKCYCVFRKCDKLPLGFGQRRKQKLKNGTGYERMKAVGVNQHAERFKIDIKNYCCYGFV